MHGGCHRLGNPRSCVAPFCIPRSFNGIGAKSVPREPRNPCRCEICFISHLSEERLSASKDGAIRQPSTSSWGRTGVCVLVYVVIRQWVKLVGKLGPWHFPRRPPAANRSDSQTISSDSFCRCRLSGVAELEYPPSAETRAKTSQQSKTTCLQDSPSSAVPGKTPAFPWTHPS
jgi:hypothetical protein